MRHQQDLIASLMNEPWFMVHGLHSVWKDIASMVAQGNAMLNSSIFSLSESMLNINGKLQLSLIYLVSQGCLPADS